MSKVIVFAQSKGGAGKTTAAITLACELARHGAGVTMIDADPNQHSAKWGNKDGKPEKIQLIENPQGRSIEENILDDIETARTTTPFVIVDLEGTASMAAGYAISRSDLVIVACQGSQDDADEAAKTIKLIRQQERAFGRDILFKVLITRAPAALNPRLLRGIVEDFEGQGVPIFEHRLIDREAFKAIKAFGGSLHDLTNDEVAGAAKACADVKAVTTEIIDLLKTKGEGA